jgi:hypothetical protein
MFSSARKPSLGLRKTLFVRGERDFKRGDYVVAGTYYMKHGRSADSYVFLDTSSMAHVDVHLIRACKFLMSLAAYSMKDHSTIYKMT